MTTIRVVLASWKAALLAAAEYRTDLIIGIFYNSIWLGVSIAPALVVFEHVDAAGGWTLPRLLFVAALWYGLDAIVWMLLIPNIAMWPELVRSGEMDMILLRPIDGLVMASLGTLRPQDVPKLMWAVGLAGWVALTGEAPASALAMAASLLAMLCAVVLLWAIGVLGYVKVLTSVQFDGSTFLHAPHNMSRVPVPLYGPTLRFVLTALAPVAFLTTVPAELFFGTRSAWMALVAVAIAAAAALLARLAWRHQVSRYTGAFA